MTADLQVLLTEHQPTPTHCSTETIGFVQAVINLGLHNDHDCMRQVQSNNGHLFHGAALPRLMDIWIKGSDIVTIKLMTW